MFCYHSVGELTLKVPLCFQVLCVRIWVFYCSMCLAGWPLFSEGARLRCGSELLSDLLFVCGDRGIYLGKGSWSGYGPRPRGKGIVDQCCKSSGCELSHLEMYCAKPKAKQLTTRSPTTTSTTATHTTTAVLDMFEDVFRKRLLENLGAPDSPQREAYRKKTPSSLPWKSKMSSSRVRVNMQNSTSWPPSASGRSG
ncbi:PREDICTED: insulin-like growth factor II isoform X1 [Poecilia mexicana]|uniref:Insulin-like domain-containing protein n=1 Tax=Poecilia mexicana TaxID=48701 RepID=A0A3B3XZQ2_9TELE|nr:PREDICTED: insulin-like growth factor II isoform X1 [Poecilia mexicana]